MESLTGATRSGIFFRDPPKEEDIEPALTEGTVAFMSPLYANTPDDVCLAGDPAMTEGTVAVKSSIHTMTEGTVAFMSSLYANTPDDVCLAGNQPILTEGTVGPMSRVRPTTEGAVPLGAPINPDLRTYLEACSYLTPGLRKMIYDAGLTDFVELQYLRAAAPLLLLQP